MRGLERGLGRRAVNNSMSGRAGRRRARCVVDPSPEFTGVLGKYPSCRGHFQSLLRSIRHALPRVLQRPLCASIPCCRASYRHPPSQSAVRRVHLPRPHVLQTLRTTSPCRRSVDRPGRTVLANAEGLSSLAFLAVVCLKAAVPGVEAGAGQLPGPGGPGLAVSAGVSCWEASGVLIGCSHLGCRWTP